MNTKTIKTIINNKNELALDINNSINEFQLKLSIYIDLYNIKYTNMTLSNSSNSNSNSNSNSDSNSNSNSNSNSDSSSNSDSDNTIKPIEYSKIVLEKIGNIATLNKNFNTYKKLEKTLLYSIRKYHFLYLIDHLYYILSFKGYHFNFIHYEYDLYCIHNLNMIYIIHKKIKGSIINFRKPCIIFIFIRDKLFTYNY